jgi:beta-fructofuranosidase
MSESPAILGPGAIGSARPAIHLTPPTGWMNDPNGLAVHQGRLHVFYQYEPDAPRWGRMRWGHAVTSDMVTWDHLPIALEPDPTGPDSLGCWSGCVVRDDFGRPTILYTGVMLDGPSRRASICLATGDDDLRTWHKAKEPVIGGPPAGIGPDSFRDPFVWRTDRGWAMLVGAGTIGSRGVVLRYRSEDLRRWTFLGPFLTTEQLIAACPELDIAEIDSACWECPQLVQLPDGRSILIVSIVDRSPNVRPAHVVAIAGQVAGDAFVPHRAERLGLGPDFYAPATVTLPDGRGLLLGWVPEDPPGEGEPRGWAGCLTLPRVVSVDEEGQPTITLADELADVGSHVVEWSDVHVADHRPWNITTGEHVQLTLDLEPESAAAVRIDLRVAGELVAEIRFDTRSRRLTATRIARMLVAGTTPRGMATLPSSSSKRLRLRMILDGSVLEVAAEDRVTATVRLPSVPGERGISLTTFGGVCRIASGHLRSLALAGRPEPSVGRND